MLYVMLVNSQHTQFFEDVLLILLESDAPSKRFIVFTASSSCIHRIKSFGYIYLQNKEGNKKMEKMIL